MSQAVFVVCERGPLQGTPVAVWRRGAGIVRIVLRAARVRRDLGEPIRHADLDRRPRASLLAREGLVGDGSILKDREALTDGHRR
eukprot:scaffold138215_cov139-Phaeocystis_antarctica.AAC.2